MALGAKTLLKILPAGLNSLISGTVVGAGERVIIFTRYPAPGKTKTRLIPVLGAEGAARLQRVMTEHTVNQARLLQDSSQVTVEVRYEGGDRKLFRYWLGSDLIYRAQGAGDLGDRMLRSFRQAFGSGASRAVIVGSDCPGLTASVIRQAFDLLSSSDLVLGPAVDGGYYLIGLCRHAVSMSKLFHGPAWGTSEVLAQTGSIADDLNLKVAKLEVLGDVDRPEDIKLWEKVSGESRVKPNPDPLISIIIPTLNEQENISSCLARIPKEISVEVIVADGGSTDRTTEMALSCGAGVIDAPAGRAGQMNAGARAASGELLVFLHADTLLPKEFSKLVRSTLEQPGVAAGAFRLTIDTPSRLLRVIEKTTYFRSHTLQMPYGDQAIFIRASLFHKLGGFPEFPIMEDFELMRLVRRYGRIITLHEPVLTSARRWFSHGFWRTILLNQLAVLAYLAGVSPWRIAHWYDRE